MFCRLWRKVRFLALRVMYIPRMYIIILLLMLLCSLIIRLTSGGTHLVYNALGQRGIFPGQLFYCVFYILRIVLFSIVLYFSLYAQKIYCEGLIPVALTVSTAVLLLLEYKMIFGGVSLILEMLFTVTCGFFTVLAVIILKIKNRWVSVAALSFALLQLVLFVQIISLSVCI